MSGVLRFKKENDGKKEEIKEKRDKKLVNIKNYVRSNISFAEMLKSRSNQEEPQSKRDQINNSQSSTEINNMLTEFKSQIVILIQKQQEQINNMTSLMENTDKKINYVLSIIDNGFARND